MKFSLVLSVQLVICEPIRRSGKLLNIILVFCRMFDLIFERINGKTHCIHSFYWEMGTFTDINYHHKNLIITIKHFTAFTCKNMLSEISI